MKATPGVGLDIGTMNIVSARSVTGEDGKRSVSTKRVRDVFIDLEPDAEKMLKMSNMSYVTTGDQIIVIGDEAIELANLFKREARRPLHKGVISSTEHDAFGILATIIKQVLGAPVVKNEACVYSVPAAPIDSDMDVVFHQETFRQIIRDLGYTPTPINEAAAIVFAECVPEFFTGLAFSFGAGMVNAALVYKTITGISFSVSRAGDWIDSSAARAVGTTASKMCTLKERGLDLTNPETREQKALTIYYENLIQTTLDTMSSRFKQSEVEVAGKIPIILSGGTSKAVGFLDFFKKVLESQKGFPFEVSEVRMATDPLTAVAKGALVNAAQEH